MRKSANLPMPGSILKLFIDEDSQAHVLVNKLRKAGHDVMTVADAALGGQPDAVVLDVAHKDERILLTGNCVDFRALLQILHEENPTHPGIVCILCAVTICGFSRVSRDAMQGANCLCGITTQAICNAAARPRDDG